MAYKDLELRRATRKTWDAKNLTRRRAYKKAYNQARSAERSEIRRYVDDVVVAELVAGQFGGKATIHEKRVALDLCRMRGFTIADTARRVGVSTRTVERHRKATREVVSDFR
jgi:hypothetical protein